MCMLTIVSAATNEVKLQPSYTADGTARKMVQPLWKELSHFLG